MSLATWPLTPADEDWGWTNPYPEGTAVKIHSVHVLVRNPHPLSPRTWWIQVTVGGKVVSQPEASVLAAGQTVQFEVVFAPLQVREWTLADTTYRQIPAAEVPAVAGKDLQIFTGGDPDPVELLYGIVVTET